MISGDNGIAAAAAAQKKKKKRSKKKKAAPTAPQYDSDSGNDSDEDLQFLGSAISSTALPNSSHAEEGVSKVAFSSYQGNHMSKSMNYIVFGSNSFFVDDPVALTIDIVLSKSTFSRDNVTKCVNRMWDEGLKYDDPDAVLRELRAEVSPRHLFPMYYSSPNTVHPLCYDI